MDAAGGGLAFEVLNERQRWRQRYQRDEMSGVAAGMQVKWATVPDKKRMCWIYYV